MSKRVHTSDTTNHQISQDPWLFRHKVCIAWLWCVKTDPLIRKCVNKDIAKKIVALIKVNLIDGIWFKGELYKLQGEVWRDEHYWYWKKHLSHCRPCVVCLRPTEDRHQGGSQEFTCEKHASNIIGQCKICEEYGHSMASVCFESFRDRYELPTFIESNQ